jgi:phenylacetate-coenzyme A ligase PaaK-like adenylate-forming protein
MVGVNIDVQIAAPGEIERSQGKAKRIVDRRDLQ